MAGFTNGPWIWENGTLFGKDNGYTVSIIEDAWFPDENEFSSENAHLIAAAPSMHDALTYILTCDHDQLMSEGMDRVRAALKLADGE